MLKRRQLPRPKGFSLLELLIALAITGILASIAYPSYLTQVRNGRRSDAIQALSQLQQAQERWRSINPSYAPNNLLATAWPDGLGITPTTVGTHYTLSIGDDASEAGYTANALARASQAADTACSTLTTTISNGTVTHTPQACWSR